MKIEVWTLIVSSLAFLSSSFTAIHNVSRQKKANIEIERIRAKRELKIAAYDKISPSMFKLIGFIDRILSDELDKSVIAEAEASFSDFQEIYISRKSLYNKTELFEETTQKIGELFQFLKQFYFQKTQIIFSEDTVISVIIPAKQSIAKLEAAIHRDVFEEIATK